MPSTPIDSPLYTLVKNSADVVAIAGTRVYAVQAPQGTSLPLVVFTREDGDRRDFGHMTAHTGYVRATYTFSCLAASLLTSRNLARAVRRVLQYAKGSGIRHARVVQDQDFQEAPATGEQLPTYRTDLMVEVIYIETV